MLSTEEKKQLISLLRRCESNQAKTIADQLEAEGEPTEQLIAEAHKFLTEEHDRLLDKKAAISIVRDQVIQAAATSQAIQEMVEEQAQAIIDGTDEDGDTAPEDNPAPVVPSTYPASPVTTSPVIEPPVVPSAPAPLPTADPQVSTELESPVLKPEEPGIPSAQPVQPTSTPSANPQDSVLNQSTANAQSNAQVVPPISPFQPPIPPALPPSAFPDQQ